MVGKTDVLQRLDTAPQEELRFLREFCELQLQYELAGLPNALERDSLKDAHKAKGRIDLMRAVISDVEAVLRARAQKARA